MSENSPIFWFEAIKGITYNDCDIPRFRVKEKVRLMYSIIVSWYFKCSNKTRLPNAVYWSGRQLANQFNCNYIRTRRQGRFYFLLLCGIIDDNCFTTNILHTMLYYALNSGKIVFQARSRHAAHAAKALQDQLLKYFIKKITLYL